MDGALAIGGRISTPPMAAGPTTPNHKLSRVDVPMKSACQGNRNEHLTAPRNPDRYSPKLRPSRVSIALRIEAGTGRD